MKWSNFNHNYQKGKELTLINTTLINKFFKRVILVKPIMNKK